MGSIFKYLSQWSVVIFTLVGISQYGANAQSLGLPCDNSGYKGLLGIDSRLEYYFDPETGRDVEVWCRRGFLGGWQHWELRISYPAEMPPSGIAPVTSGEPVTEPVRQEERTVGGCYFDGGDNAGPDINTAPGTGRFTKVHWSNTDVNDTGKVYEFTYDWTTGKLTIKTTGGPRLGPGGTQTTVVDPPNSWDALAKLLPDPPVVSKCTLERTTSGHARRPEPNIVR